MKVPLKCEYFLLEFECKCDFEVFLPSISTQTTVSSVSKPVKNPNIEMTETYSSYE